MSKLSKKDEKLALELPGRIITEYDLNNLSKYLLKLTVEKALNTEMDEHLGYKKSDISGNNSGNGGNGTRGMTTRDISEAFKEMYDVDISSSLVSKVTDAVKEELINWQNRPLDSVYPIVHLDCIVVKIQKYRRVINKSFSTSYKYRRP